jgi:protoporphyrinogen oxidase
VPNGKSVGIVGGGITGLAAAYELSKRGFAVTLFERDDSLGGLAGSFKVEGQYLEKFYHHLFFSDYDIVSLLKEIGLIDKLLWLPGNVGVYYANSIYRLNSPLDLLRFKPLSFWGRIRMGLGALCVRRLTDWKALDRMTVRDFVEKYMGEEVYRVVWEPLFRSKFDDDADRISAAWLWTKLRARGERGRKRKETLGYLDGGFGLMFDELEKRVLVAGGTILKRAPVERIEIQNGRACGVFTGGRLFPFDSVLCTTAVPIFLRLAPGLPGEYASKLAQIRYQGTVCLVLKLKHSLSQTYWLNVNDPEIPFVGVIEHTNFQSKASYGDAHIAYLSRYVNTGHRLYSLSKEQLLEEYVPHLQKMFPEFRRDWIVDTHLWKEDYTQPIALVNYSDSIPAYRSPVKGLYLSTMAQVYPEDRGINYGIKTAREAVLQIAEDLEGRL